MLFTSNALNLKWQEKLKADRLPEGKRACFCADCRAKQVNEGRFDKVR